MKSLLALILSFIEILFTILCGLLTMIPGYLGRLRVKLHKDWDYRGWLKRDLADCASILELGCGSSSPLLYVGYGQRTCAVDIWQPYIDMHNRNRDYKQCWRADILNMPYPEKAFDAVVICDVMEHLPKDKALAMDLFKKMEACARKKVIIFAPNGFIENDHVDGDPWQEHVSAWEPEEYLKRGYQVKGTTGLRYLLGKAGRPKYHPYSITEIIAMLSLPYIASRPGLAWHSYCVKELN